MKTLKLTNNELIGGMQELQVILGYTIPFVTKFHLTSLGAKLEDALKPFETLRKELLEKYTKPETEGGTPRELKTFKDETAEIKEFTDEFKAFQEELKPVLDQEVEFSFTPIKMGLLEKIETDQNFPFLYKVVEL
jgi:hypothetical protein